MATFIPHWCDTAHFQIRTGSRCEAQSSVSQFWHSTGDESVTYMHWWKNLCDGANHAKRELMICLAKYVISTFKKGF